MREWIERYLAELERENSSAHTVRNYRADLEQFDRYFTPPDAASPAPGTLTALDIREWLGDLHGQQLSVVTIRRKLAAVRSLFKYLARERVVSTNPAKLVRSAKLPKTLPPVLTAEQTNGLIDGVAGGKHDGPQPKRDLAIMELLYGCGMRVSELCGLDLNDIDFRERWLLVRGKGKKERQVPFGERAAGALEIYLQERKPARNVTAVFLNRSGGRLTDRSVRNIVKLYSTAINGDSSVHPHSFRHAYATHLLADGADLRSIQELLGHARLSTTQRYTQIALADLMATYDKAHPKA